MAKGTNNQYLEAEHREALFLNKPTISVKNAVWFYQTTAFKIQELKFALSRAQLSFYMVVKLHIQLYKFSNIKFILIKIDLFYK